MGSTLELSFPDFFRLHMSRRAWQECLAPKSCRPIVLQRHSQASKGDIAQLSSWASRRKQRMRQDPHEDEGEVVAGLLRPEAKGPLEVDRSDVQRGYWTMS